MLVDFTIILSIIIIYFTFKTGFKNGKCELEKTDVDFFPLSSYNEETFSEAVKILKTCGISERESRKKVSCIISRNPNLFINEIVRECLK